MPRQAISDAALLTALTGASGPSTPAGVQQAPSAPAQMSDADLIKALTAGASTSGTGTGAQAQGSTASKADTPLWRKALTVDQHVGAGMIRGLEGVVSSVDPVAQWLDKHVGSVTLGGIIPTADQAHENSVAAAAAYKKKYGNSLAAEGGHLAGNLIASAIALAAGGSVVSGLAKGAEAIPYLGRAAQFIGGATETNPLLRVAQGAARGVGTGGAAAASVSSESSKPFWEQVRQGAEFGGLLGGGAPLVSGLVRKGVNAIASSDINPLRSQLAARAVSEFGIPLRWSQISESRAAKFLDSNVGKMPLSGLGGQNEAQIKAFTRAVSNTFGEDSEKLTPDIMSQARQRIGSVFNRVADNTNIQNAPETVIAPISNILGEASQVLPEGEVKPLLKQMENIGASIDPETKAISGKTYQALTRKGSPLDRAMGSSNPNVRFYAGQIRGALDDGLQASTAPSDLRALQDARLQWKNMRTVQDLASKAGIEGEISPGALLGAVKKSYKNMAYGGAGDIGDLARIGQEFLKEPPSSNTAEHLAIYQLLGRGGRSLAEAGVAGGAAGAGLVTAPLQTGAALGGILAMGRGVGVGLRSTTLRNRLLEAASRGAPEIFAPSEAQTLLGRFGVPTATIARQELLNLPAPANISHP